MGELIAVLPVLAERRVPDDLELVGLVLGGHGLLEPTSEVVIVPKRLDTQHPAAGCQAGIRRGLVPVPELVADENRVGLLLILDRVIDDQNVAVMGEDPFNEEVPRRGLEINCYFTFSSNQLRNAACGPARSE